MAIERFLPSKQLTFIAGALIFSGALIIGASYWGSVKAKPAGMLVFDDIIRQASEIDSDNDGLKDWEEGIRGSDAQNPDTDGDGVPDGEEVSQGRDPTVPGPNDRAKEAPNPLQIEEKAYGESDDVTEDVSKEFLARYLTLKAEGRLDELTQEELIIGLAASVKLERTPKIHKEGDFAVVSNTKENLRTYGNGLVAATSKYQEYASYFSLLNAIGLALDTEGIKGGEAFAATKNAYRAMVDAYARLTVPNVVAADHLEFLNLFERALTSIVDIERAGVDPIRAIAGLQQYQEYLSRATLVLKRIGAKIDPDGILFSTDEPGYLLRNLKSVPE